MEESSGTEKTLCEEYMQTQGAECSLAWLELGGVWMEDRN